MLYSAVKKQCPLEVFAKGCGQNGPVLGMSCALFLANCMGYLAFIYDQKVKHRKKNPYDFQAEIYDESIKQMLDKFSEEDADAHGRLIEIKKYLLGIDDRILELDADYIEKFNLNDFKVFKVMDSGTITGSKEARLEQFRKDYLYYGEWEQDMYSIDVYLIKTDRLPVLRRELHKKKGYLEKKSDYEVLEQFFVELDQKLKCCIEGHKMDCVDDFQSEISKSIQFRDQSSAGINMMPGGGGERLPPQPDDARTSKKQPQLPN